MAPQMSDRREFLRFVGAAAGAAGLCHFRFLNLGMAAGLTAPDQDCQPGTTPDQCLQPLEDVCIPQVEPDVCIPQVEPDECIPPALEPDVCEPLLNEPDTCDPALGEPDVCEPQIPEIDICEPAFGEPDVCDPLHNNPDVCDPANNDPDLCEPLYGDPDQCPEVGGGADQDICDPGLDPEDVCDPFDISPDALAVTLAAFGAQAEGDHVLLAWETVTEVNNLGFNLYRSTTPAAMGDLLAFVPSQAPGSTAGASYTYADHDVSPGNTYYYWLEDVEFGGASSLHGPVSATVAAPTAVKLNHLSAAAAPSRRDASALLVSLLGGMALTVAGLAGHKPDEADEQA